MEKDTRHKYDEDVHMPHCDARKPTPKLFYKKFERSFRYNKETMI